MIKTPIFCQIVRYTVFLCMEARKGYTQAETIKSIEQAQKDFLAGKAINEDLLRLIPELVTESMTSNPSRKKKEIFEKSMKMFPVITIDKDDNIHANELLLAPVIHASNEIIFNLCANEGNNLIYYMDDAHSSSSSTDQEANDMGYLMPSPPVYPFQWIREIGVNAIVCWQLIEEELTTAPLHHLWILDMSDNKLLLPGSAPALRKPQKPTVAPAFQEALTRLVVQTVHEQWKPYHKATIPAKFDFYKKEKGEQFYDDYRTFNRMANSVNFETLYKIGIEEVRENKIYLAWHNPKNEKTKSQDNSELALLYFYPRRWSLRKNSNGLIYFALEFIPARLVMGRKQNYEQIFDLTSGSISNALVKLFDGCHLPLYYFRFAQMDNTAEDHLRHRNDTYGYVVEQDELLKIYQLAIAQEMDEEEIEVEPLNDTSLCSDFIGAGPNDSGKFCIYRKRLKRK